MIIKVAKYLNVAPWDLMEQSAFWFNWALTLMADENYAEAEHAKDQERRARLRRTH